MARQVQIIKGTTAQNEAFTGAEGVLTYDSDKKDIRIHDGTTAGGFEIPSAAMADYVIYWDSADSSDHSHAKPGVETPTDHGWYRVYKSGWCEQGGNATAVNAGSVFALLIEMSDANYTIVCGKYGHDTDGVGFNIQPYTTTQFSAGVAYGTALTRQFSWQVSGYAA